jgi:uncharacterized membrane protein
MEITKAGLMEALCAGLLVIAGWSLIEGNETIFPTALVGSLLLLLLIMDPDGGSLETGRRDRMLGSAGRSAIITFAVLIAVSSLLYPSASRVLPKHTTSPVCLTGISYG